MNRIIKFVCLFLAIAIVIIPLKRTVTRTSDGFDPGGINIMKK
ncbi:Uncharacterised protein [Streptococcus suis]|uniref:Uncharacterized protein n=1 Tax=Streptococcus suis TaxID=1307 RepID=A0A0Z8N3T2_STRSU|nr:Uncharacterised protein [Streptococcus suis]